MLRSTEIHPEEIRFVSSFSLKCCAVRIAQSLSVPACRFPGGELCGNFSDTSSLKFGTPPVQRPPNPPDHPLAFSVRLCLFLSASVQMLALAPLDTQPPRPWLRARVAAASGGGVYIDPNSAAGEPPQPSLLAGKMGGSLKKIFLQRKKNWAKYVEGCKQLRLSTASVCSSSCRRGGLRSAASAPVGAWQHV